jgi:hypothetical protein|tara:strand:+ start:966 stop:1139 length:174 start_codon:yes stop_codon:yes gene_type:complete
MQIKVYKKEYNKIMDKMRIIVYENKKLLQKGKFDEYQKNQIFLSGMSYVMQRFPIPK